MRTIDNLQEVLEKHQKWLNVEEGGERADLSDANLSDADLRCANLSNADLRCANLDEQEQRRKGIILKKPREAYKRCGKYIVQLLIPSGAIVFSINNDRCRTNKAYVMAILNDDETIANTFSVASDYKRDFIYKVGQSIEIEDFDLMYNVECSTGIHFFWDFERARDYN